MKSGIYRFLNFINGKMYIGSAVSLKNRKKNHLLALKLNKHHNGYLQAAYNKYGKENLLFEVLEFVENKEKLIEREQHWLNKFKSCDRNLGYNLSPTAGSPLGVKHTAEFKAKVTAALTGRIVSEETKAKIAASNTGKKASAETRIAIASSLKGRSLSLEHAQNIGMARRNVVDWPCFNGYYCKCDRCKSIRASRMREYRNSKQENGNGA